MSNTHTINIRVYYEDTDCAGIVYYANYLKYMERGRTELLRAAGIELGDYHDQGIVFPVVEASVKYRQSARYGDLLTVVTTVKEVAGTTTTCTAEIYKDNTLLVTGETRVACLNTASGKPCRIPPDMRAAILGAKHEA